MRRAYGWWCMVGLVLGLGGCTETTPPPADATPGCDGLGRSRCVDTVSLGGRFGCAALRDQTVVLGPQRRESARLRVQRPVSRTPRQRADPRRRVQPYAPSGRRPRGRVGGERGRRPRVRTARRRHSPLLGQQHPRTARQRGIAAQPRARRGAGRRRRGVARGGSPSHLRGHRSGHGVVLGRQRPRTARRRGRPRALRRRGRDGALRPHGPIGRGHLGRRRSHCRRGPHLRAHRGGGRSLLGRQRRRTAWRRHRGRIAHRHTADGTPGRRHAAGHHHPRRRGGAHLRTARGRRCALLGPTRPRTARRACAHALRALRPRVHSHRGAHHGLRGPTRSKKTPTRAFRPSTPPSSTRPRPATPTRPATALPP